MSYCTVEDIISRVPADVIRQLTQDSRQSSHINELVVESAISDAVAIIDSKLLRRYILPLPSSGILRKITIDIAIYHIYRNRYDNKIPEEVRNTYDETMKLLESIKQGTDDLPSAFAHPNTTFIVKTNKVKSDKVFTTQAMSTL